MSSLLSLLLASPLINGVYWATIKGKQHHESGSAVRWIESEDINMIPVQITWERRAFTVTRDIPDKFLM